MSRLEWYKFDPAKWAMGKTRKLTPEQRDDYLFLCGSYWSKGCEMTSEELKEETENYDLFLSKGLLSENGILWLNDQMDEVLTRSKSASERGKKGAKAKAKQKVSNSQAVAKQESSKSKQIEIENKNKIKKEIKIKEKEKKREVIFPFLSDGFIDAWENWKAYRWEQHKYKFRSPLSEQASLKKISTLAKNDTEAIAIIEQSIGNGWKGFFELKQQKNEQTRATGGVEHAGEWLNNY